MALLGRLKEEELEKLKKFQQSLPVKRELNLEEILVEKIQTIEIRETTTLRISNKLSFNFEHDENCLEVVVGDKKYGLNNTNANKIIDFLVEHLDTINTRILHANQLTDIREMRKRWQLEDKKAREI